MALTDAKRIEVDRYNMSVDEIVGYGKTISDVIKQLQEIEATAINEHGDTACVTLDSSTDYGYYGDPDTTVIEVVVKRDETEQETTARVNRHRRSTAAGRKAAATRRANKEDKDRAEYERLKAIYWEYDKDENN